MFDDPQPYAAHLRVGVHSWDVSSSDDPDYGPLAGVRFTWQARQDDGWPTQHEPTLLVFGVIVEQGNDFDDVDQGTVVHFTFTPDGYATPLLEFGGTVRDLTATPHPRGMVYTITAVDHLQGLREKYTVSAAIGTVVPPGDSIWRRLIADAAGAGAGNGIRPALVDPFTGTDAPPTTGANLSSAILVKGNAWDVFVGYMGTFLDRAGTNVPRRQRPILTYRLDGAGNLSAAQPYQARWTQQGYGNSPLSLVETSPGVYGIGGGNVDGCTLRTAGTVWSRQRVEPNRVEQYTSVFPDSPFIYTRLPEQGPPPAFVVTRTMDGEWWEGNQTDARWVLSGYDSPDQWSSAFSLLGSYDPAAVAGWFTLPTAMRIMVAAYDVDERHTPTGSGRMLGMLAGASLVIGPRGLWDVGFTLRRTLPDWWDVYIYPSIGRQDYGYGQWAVPQAVTSATINPAITSANIDPTLTSRDALLIGA